MAQFGSRTVAPASRSHFQIFYSDNLLKGNLRNFHQMAPFGSRTVAPASRSHFQIFYSDNYFKMAQFETVACFSQKYALIIEKES